MIKQIQYILILSLCLVNNALALIEIDITEGNREPLPIAISDFFYDGKLVINDGAIKEFLILAVIIPTIILFATKWVVKGFENR